MRNRSRSDPRLRHLPDEKITAEEATNMAEVGIFHIKLIMIAGFVWMARGFDLIVMRYVASFMTCSWDLTLWQGAILDGATLFSTILGCIMYGIWSDQCGRKKAFYSVFFLFLFGALSAASPNFVWFVIFRTLAAFSVGGLYQTLVLCLEMFPGTKRGQVVYTLGAFYVLSLIIMQHIMFSTLMRGHGWKLFVFLGTLPALVAACLWKIYPESFRYRMVEGKYAEANDIVGKMLKGSGKKMTAQLMELPEMKCRKLVWDFLMLPFKGSFFWLMTLGLLISICYRGLVDWPERLQAENLPFPKINIVEHGFAKVSHLHYAEKPMNASICCTKLINLKERKIFLEDFKLITLTTAFEFSGYVVYLILADLVNRKLLMTASCVLSPICCILQFTIAMFFFSSRQRFTGMNVLFFLICYCTRTLLLGQLELLLLMVAEAFPTSHRGMAVGLEVATFYIGQFIGFFLFIGCVKYCTLFYFLPYIGLLILCLLVSWKKLEKSRGKELKDVYEKQDVYENVEEN